MQISAQNLFNLIKQNPKQAQEIIKNTLELVESSTDDITKTKAPNKEQNLNELMAKLSKGEITKTQILKIIKNNPLFKSQTQPIKELEQLVTLAKKEPKLSKFLPPLKEFLKHISTTNANNLKSQVQNSGIGFENKIKLQSLEPKLPKDIKTAIKEFIASNNIKDETILKIAKNILTKKEVFSPDIKELKTALKHTEPTSLPPKLQKVFKSLENLQKLTQNETFSNNSLEVKHHIKELKSVLKFLQNNIKIDKKPTPQDSHKLPNENKIMHKNQTNTTNKASASVQNINVKTQTKQIIKQMQDVIKSLEPQPQMQNNIKPSNPQTTDIKTTNLPLQDKIKILVNKLEQSVKLNFPTHHEDFSKHKSTKKLLHELNKLELPNPKEHSIDKDIKKSLLQIKEKTSSHESKNFEQINKLSTKTLSNIETNQLISYANNSINTNIPYIWEGLREGKLAFKQGKDDSFYCQIDLEFKEYGKLNMMLMLSFNKYINMSISTEKEEFKDRIMQNLAQLKQALNKQNLSLQVSVKPFSVASKYDDDFTQFSMDIKA